MKILISGSSGLIGSALKNKLSSEGHECIGLSRDFSQDINFDGIDLAKLPDAKKRRYWGTRMTYVAQSAAASFNPAHRLIAQTTASTVRSGIL